MRRKNIVEFTAREEKKAFSSNASLGCGSAVSDVSEKLAAEFYIDFVRFLTTLPFTPYLLTFLDSYDQAFISCICRRYIILYFKVTNSYLNNSKDNIYIVNRDT
jgi:hypothetical protein